MFVDFQESISILWLWQLSERLKYITNFITHYYYIRIAWIPYLFYYVPFLLLQGSSCTEMIHVLHYNMISIYSTRCNFNVINYIIYHPSEICDEYTFRDVSTPSVIVDTRSKLLLRNSQCASSVVSCSKFDSHAHFNVMHVTSSLRTAIEHIELSALTLWIH